MGTRMVVATLIVALGLTGCVSQESTDAEDAAVETETPQETADSSADSRPSDKPDRVDAQQALEAAVAVMRAEPAVGFRADILIGRTPLMVTEGVFVADGWQSSSQVDDPTTSKRGDYTLETIFTDGGIWMQMNWTDARAGC